MVNVPDIPFRRRRQQSRPAPAPPPPLTLVSAEIVSEGGGDLLLRVYFNTTEAQPLVEAIEYDASKWSARRADVRFNGGNVSWVDFDRLEVALQAGEADEGADGLDYSNAPSDVADTLGRELAAFVGVPL